MSAAQQQQLQSFISVTLDVVMHSIVVHSEVSCHSPYQINEVKCISWKKIDLLWVAEMCVECGPLCGWCKGEGLSLKYSLAILMFYKMHMRWMSPVHWK